MSRNISGTPLLVCAAALVIAALVLAMIASGLVNPGGSGTPAWSGAKGPPGVVGLGPTHDVLHGR